MSVLSVTQPTQDTVVNKPIKLIEFVFACLTFLGIIVGIYVNITNTNVAQDERIKVLEQQYNKIDSKTDKILDKLESLFILTANKQDRPQQK